MQQLDGNYQIENHTHAMTEQEAELLAARLKRVWEVKHLNSSEWTLEEGAFDWFADLCEDARISLFSGEGHNFLDASLVEDNMTLFFSPSVQIHVGPPSPYRKEDVERFTAKWLPFFRRGCWLSGCDIEASAHEKVEWMQDFAKKEIDAWNLKM